MSERLAQIWMWAWKWSSIALDSRPARGAGGLATAAADRGWSLLAEGLRRLPKSARWTPALLGAAWAQPLLRRMQRAQVYRAYRDALRRVPAYRAFAAEHGRAPVRSSRDLAALPVTDKRSYVARYPLSQRCVGGRLPRAGVIDQSSGSSGAPNLWVRGWPERAATLESMRFHFGLIFTQPPYVLVNCFAPGVWATGMTVSAALGECGLLETVGADSEKLDQTLRQLGPGHRYILFGYPPFLKRWLATTALDLRGYHLEAVVGGEGMSEALRASLEQTFARVVSSYGASDLEINIGTETELTRALRQRCAADPQLSRALFGAVAPPMIFQYNPLEYRIETNREGELLFTVCRAGLAAPKLRYNLHDQGGVLTVGGLRARLAERGIDLGGLAARYAHLPIVYVGGRSDASVAFYGAKVTPADVDQAIHADPALAAQVRSFQLRVDEQADLSRTLVIALEQQRDGAPLAAAALAGPLQRRLAAVNQDFRAIQDTAGSAPVRVEVYACGSGPFATYDPRLKHRYVVPVPPQRAA